MIGRRWEDCILQSNLQAGSTVLVLGDVFNSTGNPGLPQWRGGLCGLRGPGIKNCDYATEVGGYRHHTQNPDKLPVGISRTPEVGERGVRPSRECRGWPVPGCRRHPRPADALRLTPQRARLLRGSFPELRLAAGSEAAPHPNSQQQARRGEVSGTFQERIVHPLSTPGEPLAHTWHTWHMCLLPGPSGTLPATHIWRCKRGGRLGGGERGFFSLEKPSFLHIPGSFKKFLEKLNF